jgi:oxygen-dependent protoporphyrinogen oxidase
LIARLVADAGLQSRRMDPDPKAEARYVVRYRRPIEMPAKPLGFFTTPLFTLGAKLAVLREPFRPAKRDAVEESIADFVRRRLCREFLDHAIDALVAGIYAGDPEKLSVQQAFPKLAALEEKYGSMIKGQILGARERKKSGEVAKDRAPKFSFDEGLQVLPDTLRDLLGTAVRLNTAVTRLKQIAGGWTVSFQGAAGHGEDEHSAVLYAGTAFKLAELQVEPAGAARLDLSPFSGVRYPPVASVVLGFRREDVAHSCNGFGMLIPKIEGFKILGTIFSSALFPNRAPAGHHTLTSYVGGERYPELASLPAEKLYEIVCEDLRVLLGVRGKPTFAHTVYWPKAIPQYNLGYGKYRALMTEIESRTSGFFLAGHYRDGVSLGDSMVSGVNVVDRIEKHLKAGTSTTST